MRDHITHGTPATTTVAEDTTVATLYEALERALLHALVPAAADPARLDAVGRAEAAVVALHTSLDARGGDELARRLGALYRYIDAELRAQRRTPDDDRLDELLELTVALRASVRPAAAERHPAASAG